MEADPERVHEHEGHRQDERDRHRDDETRAQAQAHERDGEHDRHRFGQRADELAHRARHGARHARDVADLDSGRQLRLDLHELRVERAPEVDHVAALDHRHADAERLTSVPAHLLLRRIDVAARHVRDVAEPEHAVVRADREVADGVLGIERARGAEVDAVGRRLEGARRRHRVLRSQRLHDLPRLDAEQREPRIRQLDEDLLLLLADEVDLGHAGNAQQLGAHPVAELLQVAVAEAVARERVDVRVGVAELVVEVRSLDARRQLRPDVADLLAHLVLEVGNRGGRQRCP